ncbi:MAG: DEAD/DEAH box helicase [Oligoflexia bacterium]|nr:DEAD/DEAH box helicase [Oligoflexia bacterium]
MLFYSQLKREFNTSTWKRGQTLFREDRVQDVKLDGSKVNALVSECDVRIEMVRGTIGGASCGCDPNAGRARLKCEHIAALCIWIVERGSLLRSRVVTTTLGASVAEPGPERSRQAEGVAYVRGIFQDGALSAVTVEPAIRYYEPDSGERPVITLNRLVKAPEFRAWRTAQGLTLQLASDFIPLLTTVDAAKLVYSGQTALEGLARILEMENKKQIVLHESVQARTDSDPLKLATLRIGAKSDKSRVLTYEFRNSTCRISSAELHDLSLAGRLSNTHVWKDGVIYRFYTPLSLISQYVNRSGIAAPEGATSRPGKPVTTAFAPDGFGYLHDDESHPLHPLAAYRLSLELGVDDFQVDSDWEAFHEWKRNFEKKRSPAMPDANYGFELRDYQVNGLTWMWSLYHRGLAALLADDMGLGKTHQVLAFFSTIYCGVRSRPKHPSLVIAPTSVLAAWGQKLRKYDTGLKWTIFHGNARTLPKGELHLVLTTYGILQREAALRDLDWHVIALDEAQAIKNASTISSRATRMLKSKFRIAMTGTPIENQSTDLWSIMEFLLPGYLGSLPRFKRLYGSGRDAPSVEKAQALKRLVSPFLLRRTKSQVLKELPEKTEEMILCEMTQAQKKAYRLCLTSAEAAKAREDLEGAGKIDYANILALLTRLKQVCDHPRLADITSGKVKKIGSIDPAESGKWEAVSELIQEAVGSSLKVVIFTQYLGMIDLIGHHLKTIGIGYQDLRGDSQDRVARLERFANDPDCKVFVCSLLAGGLGIDLTAASVCIHLDRWWNPAKENQATDRLHRIGQTRGVQVFKLQIPGTVEDRIAGIIESKLELSGALIEESPVGLKAFSRRELLELLTPPPL